MKPNNRSGLNDKILALGARIGLTGGLHQAFKELSGWIGWKKNIMDSLRGSGVECGDYFLSMVFIFPVAGCLLA
jgi:hypothetical protein